MGKLKGQKIVFFCLILFSILFCYGALTLEVGRLAQPGPGFAPLLVGIFLGVLSFIAFLKSPKQRTTILAGEADKLFHRKFLMKHFLFLASLVAYGLIITHHGFLMSSFMLMFSTRF